MNDPIAEYVKNGEISYATRVDTLWANGGKNRIRIAWKLPPNKNAVKAVIYWNNQNDMKEVPTISSPNGQYELLLDNIPQGAYLFNLFTLDSEGNKSVGLSVSASSYGTNFQSTIVNRTIASKVIKEGAIDIKWNGAEKGDTGTLLSYTHADGDVRTIVVKTTDNETSIIDIKRGTELNIQSQFLPEPGALDIFVVTKKDVILIP
jgi:hypothetical protein